MNLTFSIDSTKVEKTIANITSEIRDFSRPFNAVGDDLLQFYGGEVFTTNGKAIGENWRRLANSTLLSRANRTGYYANPPASNAQTLVWTGRLQKGFKKEVQPKQLRIFNPVPYFKYHQQAGGRPPQRKMLAVTSKVIVKVVDAFDDYLTKTVEKSAV